MTKHRYLLIEISKEFEPIVKNAKAIPPDHEAYCIIDLATATISKDGKNWTPFEIEGEIKPSYGCDVLWCCNASVGEHNGRSLCEFHLKKNIQLEYESKVCDGIIEEVISKTPIPDIRIETCVGSQLSKTLDVIEKLTHFKPCNNNDNQSCESYLSLGKGCKGCPNNESEKSK